MKPEQFVRIICSKYEHKEGVFANRSNAEDFVPLKTSSKNQARFLFYIIGLDYATKSQGLYQRANKLFSQNKQYFDPSYLISLDANHLLSEIVLALKPRYSNEAVKRYQINSQLLLDKYDANPL